MEEIFEKLPLELDDDLEESFKLTKRKVARKARENAMSYEEQDQIFQLHEIRSKMNKQKGLKKIRSNLPLQSTKNPVLLPLGTYFRAEFRFPESLPDCDRFILPSATKSIIVPFRKLCHGPGEPLLIETISLETSSIIFLDYQIGKYGFTQDNLLFFMDLCFKKPVETIIQLRIRVKSYEGFSLPFYLTTKKLKKLTIPILVSNQL